jgi:chromosome segregation ATPase
MNARDTNNINNTVEIANTLGMAGAGYTAATGATVLGAGVGTVAAGAVLAGGAGFTVGNRIGRWADGSDVAEEELAKNLEQEQRLIDGSGATRARYSKENQANLSKIEKERAAGFKNASKSDADEFAADRKSISGSKEERLSSIDSLRTKNESQRDEAAKESNRLAEVLSRAEQAGPNTSFGMQADGIRKDLEAQNKILQQQEQQLKALADERLKIEKEIAKTRTESTESATKAESSKETKESTEKNSKDLGVQMANSVEKKLREVVDHFDEKIADLKLVDSNVRNGG